MEGKYIQFQILKIEMQAHKTFWVKNVYILGGQACERRFKMTRRSLLPLTRRCPPASAVRR